MFIHLTETAQNVLYYLTDNEIFRDHIKQLLTIEVICRIEKVSNYFVCKGSPTNHKHKKSIIER